MIPCPPLFDKARAWFWPLFLLVGNLLVVVGTDLAHDEAYYWMYAQHPAWGYFDHPPMVGWWIALTTHWIPGELGVRLPFLLATQASAWLMGTLVPTDRRWQVWASFSAFPLLAASGVFALPDGALVALSAAWLWALDRALKRDDVPHALLMGLVAAALLYSKYHGVLFLGGTLLALPRLLKRPTFWLAVSFALVLYAPHALWQHEHGYATFRYHFVDRPSVTVGWQQPLGFLGLQIVLAGLLLGPALWRSLFRTKAAGDFERVLKTLAWFVPLFFFFSTFSKKVEANWTVAAALPMLVYLIRKGRFPTGWPLHASIMVILILRLVLVAPPSWHGIGRTEELHGWGPWAKSVRQAAGPECGLSGNRYQYASKLAFYLRDPSIYALNVKTRLNQFEFWDLRDAMGGRPVCWVTEKRNLFPGQRVDAPDGKKLVLVKGVALDDILALKGLRP